VEEMRLFGSLATKSRRRRTMNDGYAEGTAPLRRVHGELLPHIERLRLVANSIGTAPVDHVRQGVKRIHEFLEHELIPHAQGEDEVLYPAVGQLLGSPLATATMSRDHVAVRELTDELGRLRAQMRSSDLDPTLMNELRRVLYGLYTLIWVHFAKEQEIYFPMLDEALTREAATELFERMHEKASAGQWISRDRDLVTLGRRPLL
jgi:iron-sulfur cluster repair protein YtfE (RIC family)